MSTKMFTKILAVLMLASIVLSACSPATEPPATEPLATEPPATEEPTSTEEPAPSGHLLIWVQKINMEAWQNTVLPAFQEMYPNVEIEFVNNGPSVVADNVGLCIQGGTG